MLNQQIMKIFCAAFFVTLSIFSGYAQNINPGEDIIYRTDEIASVYLSITSQDSLVLFDEENQYSDDYLRAQIRFVNSSLDTLLPFDVGIRLRGNTSRQHPKKSFKIKFREYDGDRFFSYKHFNFKAENNDPSFLREHMSLQSFRAVNIAAARSHHAKVFLNNQYMGLYLNVEQINNDFVEDRFGNKAGNLYKCIYGSSLKLNNDVYDEGVFELKTNENKNDRSILENFIHLLNNTDENEFEAMIEENFEVDRFLKYLAVEALTGHWDGYSFNQNNYYLYENSSSKKIEFIPYDVDNTFGIDWISGDWGKHNVLNWAHSEDSRPLTNRILARPIYFTQYVNNLKTILEEVFTTDTYFPEFDRFKELLHEAVATDEYFPLTFGFHVEDYNKSHSEAIGGHLQYGLKDYMEMRIATAWEQISTVTTNNQPFATTTIYPNPNNGQQLNIKSKDPISQIELVDLLGKRQDFQLIEQHGMLKISFNLPSALYLLKINGQSYKLLVK